MRLSAFVVAWRVFAFWTTPRAATVVSVFRRFVTIAGTFTAPRTLFPRLTTIGWTFTTARTLFTTFAFAVTMTVLVLLGMTFTLGSFLPFLWWFFLWVFVLINSACVKQVDEAVRCWSGVWGTTGRRHLQFRRSAFRVCAQLAERFLTETYGTGKCLIIYWVLNTKGDKRLSNTTYTHCPLIYHVFQETQGVY